MARCDLTDRVQWQVTQSAQRDPIRSWRQARGDIRTGCIRSGGDGSAKTVRRSDFDADRAGRMAKGRTVEPVDHGADNSSHMLLWNDTWQGRCGPVGTGARNQNGEEGGVGSQGSVAVA